MLKLNSNGKTGENRVFSMVPTDIQDKLNGLTLADAVSAGIIKNDKNLKFQNLTREYSNGASFDRIVLSCNVGHIPLSMPLSEGGIAKFVDNLGDLVIKKGMSWEDDATKVSHPYFHIQAPGGSVNEVLSDVDVATMAVA